MVSGMKKMIPGKVDRGGAGVKNCLDEVVQEGLLEKMSLS